MRQLLGLLGYFLTAMAVLLICFGLFGWMVQALWNTCLVPAVTVCQPLSFLQAIGLIALFHMFFKLVTLNFEKKEEPSEDK